MQFCRQGRSTATLREPFDRVLDNVRLCCAQAAFAQKAGAKGVVVINKGEALMRMPAGWMKFTEDVRVYQHKNNINHSMEIVLYTSKRSVCIFINRC